MFEIKYDLKQLKKDLNDVAQKQVPFALAQALNKTAFDIRDGWKKEMQSVFDKPVALTMNAVMYDKATKRDLSARVYIRDEAFKGTPPSRYLEPEAHGGERRMKRSERSLQIHGFLPNGMYWVPGAGAQLTPEGNIPGALMTKILSQLKSSADPMQNETDKSKARRRRIKRRGGEYFALSKPRGKLLPGVYERFNFAWGSAVKPIMIFVNRFAYTPRLKIEDVAQRTYDQKFRANFDEAMEKAMATAKP